MYFSNKITLMVLLKALLEISDLNKVFNFKFIFLPRHRHTPNLAHLSILEPHKIYGISLNHT